LVANAYHAATTFAKSGSEHPRHRLAEPRVRKTDDIEGTKELAETESAECLCNELI
jgi:hypothetical protein